MGKYILVENIDGNRKGIEHDTFASAHKDMKNRWEIASFDGEIEEAQILNNEAYVNGGKDNKDYWWRIVELDLGV